MEKIDLEKIGQWLPFLANPLELEDFLANQELYPGTIPLEEKEFWFYTVFLRAKLEKILPKKKKIARLTLGPKILPQFPSLSLALLFILDVLQPLSLLDVFVRGRGKRERKIGTIISLTDIDWRRENLGEVFFTLGEKRQKISLKAGEISLLKLEEDKRLVLDFRLKGAKVEGRKKAKVSVAGGKVGVVIDARGRPINLGEEDWEKVKRWTKLFF